MNKLLTGSLLLCLLQSCFTHRAKENESFLLLNERKNKLMILTVLPAANDSTGIAVSSIFVNSFENPAGQSSVFTYVFDPKSGKRSDTSWFIDSLMVFRNPRFPALLAPAQRDSAAAFRFSFGRKKAVLETGPPVQSETEYTIRYAEQQPFETHAAGTVFGISAVTSLPATLENLQGNKPEQASVLSVHCFDRSDLLFLRDRSWYWLDYALDGKAYHLFFEADAAGRTVVHYSVSPNDEAVTVELSPGGDIQLVIRREMSAPLVIRTVSPPPGKPAKNTFRAETIALMQNGTRAGTGILYTL